MRTARSILLTIGVVATPAVAQERPAEVRVVASRLDQAIVVLGKQTGASIGLRDQRLGGIIVRRVAGSMPAHEALRRMTEGARLRIRRIAPNAYLIEAAAPRPRPAPRLFEAAYVPPPEPPPLADIVVTASKRDLRVGQYAGSVALIDGADLSSAEAARGSDAIQTRVASVASTHLGPGRNKLFIRGIADSSFIGPTQATVGQYWANTRITYSAPDPNLRLYDVRSVEVLEGPQGTLYGAGALGGIVRILPEAPSLSQTLSSAWGGAALTQHGQPSVDGGALINLPIAEDRLAFRGLVYGAQEGGYVDDRRRGLDDVNRVRTLGARGALALSPGDGWGVTLGGLAQRIVGRDSQYTERGAGLTRASSTAEPFRNRYWLTDLAVTKRWGRTELISAIGYSDQYVSERFGGVISVDPAKTPVAPTFASAATAGMSGFTQINRIRMLTSETRLARTADNGAGWVIGASFMHNDAQVRRRIEDGLRPVALAGVRNRVFESTLFGEASLVPLPGLIVTGGGRLTYSRLSGSPQDVVVFQALRFDPTASAARHETRILPSVAAAYRGDRAWGVFARYQESFRPGGLAIQQDFVQRFNGDRLGTFELGARAGGRRGDRFDVSLTAAFTRWQDIQADVVDAAGFPTTLNIGDGRVLSIGGVARWRPAPDWEFDIGAYFNDSEVTTPTVTSVQPPVTGASRGSALPNVADISARAGIAYRAQLRDGIALRASGYARYVGRSTLGIGPELGQEQGGTLDSGLEARLARGPAALSLSLTNLLDLTGNRFSLGSPLLINGQNQVTPLRPRTLRIGFDLALW